MTEQIELLADYIMTNIPDEPSRSEGAGETAVRLLQYYRSALTRIVDELGVPQPGQRVGAVALVEGSLGVR